jgi:hypothetical protein
VVLGPSVYYSVNKKDDGEWRAELVDGKNLDLAQKRVFASFDGPTITYVSELAGRHIRRYAADVAAMIPDIRRVVGD